MTDFEWHAELSVIKELILRHTSLEAATLCGHAERRRFKGCEYYILDVGLAGV